jgi:hypothetical protein
MHSSGNIMQLQICYLFGKRWPKGRKLVEVICDGSLETSRAPKNGV